MLERRYIFQAIIFGKNLVFGGVIFLKNVGLCEFSVATRMDLNRTNERQVSDAEWLMKGEKLSEAEQQCLWFGTVWDS